MTSLPQQLSLFPSRILGSTILAAVGKCCLKDPSLWVYALPLHTVIADKIALINYQRIAGPALIEGLAVTHPPETMQAFIKHIDLLQDKFDLEFFRLNIVKQLCNCLDKAHPNVQVFYYNINEYIFLI